MSAQRVLNLGIEIDLNLGYRVWLKKIAPPPVACGFQTFFDKRLRILNQFLYTYYTCLSTLDYKFLFSSLKL